MDTDSKLPDDETPRQTPADAASEAGLQPEASLGAPSGDKTMAMLCHLLSFLGFIGIPLGNILGPLVLWLIKKDEDALVNATGKEVLNFQISASIYGIVCVLLAFVVVGFILLPILLIGVVVYTIIGAMKANEGLLYRYPFTIRFIK
jgi:uncharacterized Tic20 family protein